MAYPMVIFPKFKMATKNLKWYTGWLTQLYLVKKGYRFNRYLSMTVKFHSNILINVSKHIEYKKIFKSKYFYINRFLPKNILIPNMILILSSMKIWKNLHRKVYEKNPDRLVFVSKGVYFFLWVQYLHEYRESSMDCF